MSEQDGPIRASLQSADIIKAHGGLSESIGNITVTLPNSGAGAVLFALRSVGVPDKNSDDLLNFMYECPYKGTFIRIPEASADGACYLLSGTPYLIKFVKGGGITMAHNEAGLLVDIRKTGINITSRPV